ncbi:hypothetical protein Scep_009254 [Stephania cephalantha]|uniref:Uncharacterized protein n=1 Tax=Stephania cephalantha TaxID=152367 RepID=A0AAP0JST4_9MAGN
MSARPSRTVWRQDVPKQMPQLGNRVIILLTSIWRNLNNWDQAHGTTCTPRLDIPDGPRDVNPAYLKSSTGLEAKDEMRTVRSATVSEGVSGCEAEDSLASGVDPSRVKEARSRCEERRPRGATSLGRWSRGEATPNSGTIAWVPGASWLGFGSSGKLECGFRCVNPMRMLHRIHGFDFIDIVFSCVTAGGHTWIGKTIERSSLVIWECFGYGLGQVWISRSVLVCRSSAHNALGIGHIALRILEKMTDIRIMHYPCQVSSVAEVEAIIAVGEAFTVG